MKENFTMTSADGQTMLHGFIWKPDQERPKAILQIAHGMVEYIERYDEFANYLTKKGYLVVGYDHLGHGASVQSEELHGYFAEKNGYNILIKDIRKLYINIKKEYKNIPYFLMGHSMGSFLVRRYLTVYGGNDLDGTILMGTGKQPFLVALFGVFMTEIMKRWKGSMYRSCFINNLAFGAYNRKFESPRTDKDWLSRDEEQVDRYREHPWCNFVFTVSAYQDLFRTLCAIEKRDNLIRMDKNMPIFLVSGGEDPVGNFGKGVRKVYEQYISLGMKDVMLKLYPLDRHEILNELDRNDVYSDIYRWMEKRRGNSQF